MIHRFSFFLSAGIKPAGAHSATYTHVKLLITQAFIQAEEMLQFASRKRGLGRLKKKFGKISYPSKSQATTRP